MLSKRHLRAFVSSRNEIRGKQSVWAKLRNADTHGQCSRPGRRKQRVRGVGQEFPLPTSKCILLLHKKYPGCWAAEFSHRKLGSSDL